MKGNGRARKFKFYLILFCIGNHLGNTLILTIQFWEWRYIIFTCLYETDSEGSGKDHFMFVSLWSLAIPDSYICLVSKRINEWTEYNIHHRSVWPAYMWKWYCHKLITCYFSLYVFMLMWLKKDVAEGRPFLN